MAKSSIHHFTLANGLRVIFRPLKSTQLVHCGLMINTGSRDETPQNNGVAHFIEHALFKGTKRRKAHQLFNRIESVGGEINAYTTRDNTAYYSSSLKRYLERNFDLLSDMCFNSTLEPAELEKEKRVIYEEIEMYEDSPEDSIYDEFFERLFPKHGLGYNILGSKQSLLGMQQRDLKAFLHTQYGPENMALSIAGNSSLHKVELMAQRYFGDYAGEKSPVKRKKPAEVAPFNIKVEKEFNQTQCILGTRAYSRHDEDRYALMLLNNYLGGPNMGSRLNLSVREKHGYCYHISSAYQGFDDSGLFFVSFGCDAKNLNKTLKIIAKEFQAVQEKTLGPVLLKRAKRQLQGHLAMMAENPSVLMQSHAKSMLHFNEPFNLPHLFERIDRVTAEDVQRVAREITAEDNLSQLVYLSQNK